MWKTKHQHAFDGLLMNDSSPIYCITINIYDLISIVDVWLLATFTPHIHSFALLSHIDFYFLRFVSFACFFIYVLFCLPLSAYCSDFSALILQFISISFHSHSFPLNYIRWRRRWLSISLAHWRFHFHIRSVYILNR